MLLAEADVPGVPEVDPEAVPEEDVPAVAPVEGDGVPGAVCVVLLLPAVPVVPDPAVVPVVVPDAVPLVVVHGPPCMPVPLGFMVVDGCEVVPGVGVLGDVDPGTL